MFFYDIFIINIAIIFAMAMFYQLLYPTNKLYKCLILHNKIHQQNRSHDANGVAWHFVVANNIEQIYRQWQNNHCQILHIKYMPILSHTIRYLDKITFLELLSISNGNSNNIIQSIQDYIVINSNKKILILAAVEILQNIKNGVPFYDAYHDSKLDDCIAYNIMKFANAENFNQICQHIIIYMKSINNIMAQAKQTVPWFHFCVIGVTSISNYIINTSINWYLVIYKLILIFCHILCLYQIISFLLSTKIKLATRFQRTIKYLRDHAMFYLPIVCKILILQECLKISFAIRYLAVHDHNIVNILRLSQLTILNTILLRHIQELQMHILNNSHISYLTNHNIQNTIWPYEWRLAILKSKSTTDLSKNMEEIIPILQNKLIDHYTAYAQLLQTICLVIVGIIVAFNMFCLYNNMLILPTEIISV